MTTSTEAIVTAYFDNWNRGEFDAIAPLLADNVDFVGAMGAAQGPEACVNGLRGMRGMLDEIRVVRRFVDGDDAVTLFELIVPGLDPILGANWSHVSNGQIDRIRVTFDPRTLLTKMDG